MRLLLNVRRQNVMVLDRNNNNLTGVIKSLSKSGRVLKDGSINLKANNAGIKDIKQLLDVDTLGIVLR